MSTARPLLLPLVSLLSLTVACGVETGISQLDPETLEDARQSLQAERRLGELVVLLDDVSDADRIANEFALDVLDVDDTLGAVRLSAEEEGLDELLAHLALDERVRAAEPQLVLQAYALPVDDPYAGVQWNLEQVGAADAWRHGTGSGVVVAVIDTGVADDGIDGLSNLLPGYDFVDRDRDPYDFEGHGTHVAGTINQRTDNGRGVAGLAPGAAILPVRVLGPRGGSMTDVASGIRWAVDNGADVLNLSLGGSARSQTVASAVAYAHDRGVLVVVASGNEAAPVGWPAAEPEAIAVGAVGYAGTVAGYSNTGPELDLTAPGGEMSFDRNRDGYADGIAQETVSGSGFAYLLFEGTSMAAPHVSGSLAVLLSLGATPDEARALLETTAIDEGRAGFDSQYGHGRIDLGAAVDAWLALEPGEDPGETGSGPGEDSGGPMAIADLTTGDLVVTEMMPNPGICDDASSEWIEIRNTTDRTIDLQGLVVAGEKLNTGRINSSVLVAPGGFAVLGRSSSSSFCDGGVPVDAFYGASPTLNNGGDDVRLIAPSQGIYLDISPRWSSTAAGVSFQRDSSGSWCTSPERFDGRQLGSPGRANPGCR